MIVSVETKVLLALLPHQYPRTKLHILFSQQNTKNKRKTEKKRRIKRLKSKFDIPITSLLLNMNLFYYHKRKYKLDQTICGDAFVLENISWLSTIHRHQKNNTWFCDFNCFPDSAFWSCIHLQYWQKIKKIN